MMPYKTYQIYYINHKKREIILCKPRSWAIWFKRLYSIFFDYNMITWKKSDDYNYENFKVNDYVMITIIKMMKE